MPFLARYSVFPKELFCLNSGNANRIRDRAVKNIGSFEVQCAVQLARYMDDFVWYLGHRVLALRGGAEPKDLVDGESDEDTDDGLPYLPMPESHSSSVPGRSSPPSSITNIASDQPKANAVIATTRTLHMNKSRNDDGLEIRDTAFATDALSGLRNGTSSGPARSLTT